MTQDASLRLRGFFAMFCMGLAVALGGYLAGEHFFVRSMRHAMEEKERDLARLQRQFNEARAARKAGPLFVEENAKLNQELELLAAALKPAGEPSLDPFLCQVDRHGLEVEELTHHMQSSATDSQPRKFLTEMTVSGQLSDLVRFCAEFEKVHRFASMDKIDLTVFSNHGPSVAVRARLDVSWTFRKFPPSEP